MYYITLTHQFQLSAERTILSFTKKKLNLVSWNGAAAKYDLRDWAPEHEKMGKGITLSADEVQELYEILKNIVED